MSIFNNLRSIKIKFIALVAPAVTLTAIVFVALASYLSYAKLDKELNDKLNLILSVHGNAVAEPLWNINEEGTARSVNSIVIHPEIICAAVSGTQWLGDYAWPNGCNTTSDPLNSVFSELNIRDQSVGLLTIFYTREHIYAALRREVLVNSALFFLLILVSSIVAFTALRIIVDTPLKHLMTSIRAAQGGGSRPRITWSSNDEMGSVVRDYNVMIEQVEEHNQELIYARERAESAAAGKAQFLANMSHELRTPLNAVIGITEMLREVAEDKNENLEPYERVTRAGRHLLGLINNVLDFSKIDANHVELFVEETPIQQFVLDIGHTAVELAKQNDNEYTCICGELPETMKVDQLRLKQILINLIGNACKFTRNGRVALTIQPLAKAHTPQLVFSVSDTGIGMSEEQVSRLFEDFSQIDREVSRTFGGTGLGLAISQRLCHMMGSRIDVQSIPGEGSTFSLVLSI